VLACGSESPHAGAPSQSLEYGSSLSASFGSGRSMPTRVTGSHTARRHFANRSYLPTQWCGSDLSAGCGIEQPLAAGSPRRGEERSKNW
jgi:hypothetical protein